jgi:hypothetical protein
VILLSGEHRVCVREQLQCALPSGLFVTTVKVVEFLPRARLDDGHRDFAAKDCGLDRSNGTAVFETGARALLWHRLGALDRGMIGTVRLNPAAHRDRIDAFLRTDADRRDIDRVRRASELRRY